jgi:hypothetical protein
MKSLSIAVAATALLASGLIFAQEPKQVLPHIEEQQRQAERSAIIDPQHFSDDICWVSSDWQDT